MICTDNDNFILDESLLVKKKKFFGSPKIEITELKEDSIQFTLTNVDISIANSLRRVMIGEIPTLAIELVTFEDNTSLMNDEIISQRLGLIPLYSKNCDKDYVFYWECTCDTGECDKCSITFTLDVECKTEKQMKVTSRDLISSKPLIQPFHGYDINDEIVICKLSHNQKIKLRCIARKGIGNDHSKWQPVCKAVYNFKPDININYTEMNELSYNDKIAFVKKCPTKVYSYNEKQDEVDIENVNACIFCMECSKQGVKMGKADLVKIIPRSDTLYFSVETIGALSPEDIVSTAFHILYKKLDHINFKLKLDY